MRNLKKYFFKSSAAILFLVSAVTVMGQAADTAAPAAAAPSGSSFVFDVNTVLAITVIILFLVLAVLAYTLKSSMELYKKRVDEEKAKAGNSMGAKALSLVAGLLVLGTMAVNAQAASTAAADTTQATFGQSNLLRYLLIFILLMELVAIFAVIKWLRFFTGIEDLQHAKGKKGILGLSFNSWWRKFNKFKPIKDEADIDMGHSYDGIRELDNVLPPWFTWTFIGTIIFGLVYMWRYHAAANPAPDQYQEFESAMTKAKIAQEAYIAAKGGNVDENTVTMLGASEIAEGAKLFQSNCVACHGAEGQGGIGPNLTDDYWIHGGSIGNIFHTIKVGVIEKGMQSWKDVFSATQIAELSSYIKSIHGTNPSGAKAPEGQIYKEEASAAPADSTAAAAPADSAAVQ